jgi:hypothetical protein
MIIEDTVWFTTSRGDCIGIILAKDEVTKKKKAYIGAGDGESEEEDVQIIKDWGSPLYLQKLKEIVAYLESVDV